MRFIYKKNFKYQIIQTYLMPEETTLVKICISTQIKQQIDELKGSLTYTEYLFPLVDKDEG